MNTFSNMDFFFFCTLDWFSHNTCLGLVCVCVFLCVWGERGYTQTTSQRVKLLKYTTHIGNVNPDVPKQTETSPIKIKLQTIKRQWLKYETKLASLLASMNRFVAVSLLLGCWESSFGAKYKYYTKVPLKYKQLRSED